MRPGCSSYACTLRCSYTAAVCVYMYILDHSFGITSSITHANDHTWLELVQRYATQSIIQYMVRVVHVRVGCKSHCLAVSHTRKWLFTPWVLEALDHVPAHIPQIAETTVSRVAREELPSFSESFSICMLVITSVSGYRL